MPVPISTTYTVPSHPVHKRNQSGDHTHTKPAVFQHINHAFPVTAMDLPPSYSIREEWIMPSLDDSPEMAEVCDFGSSPIGPLTPFGEYVDRAVASTQTYTGIDPIRNVSVEPLHGYSDLCGAQCYQCQPYPHVESSKPLADVSDSASPPTVSSTYKRLAEPLAEWLVSYVWKLCTIGTGQAPGFNTYMPAAINNHSTVPPAGLAPLVHSLLLSTLLQPSAVLLAVWYIARLPVYFGAIALGPDHVEESSFRAELLGDAKNGVDDGESVESHVTFRLILLGCMLANKWLDDHTFSNKTWQTISSVPIHQLNKLESLALAIFNHDLSIAPTAWSTWLMHLMSYHRSLACTHPQPISRPSATPYSVIRKAIEDIVDAPAACGEAGQPVFIGLEQRRKEKFGTNDVSPDHFGDAYEIDLDEDGPLREEYLPKRRVHHSAERCAVPGSNIEQREKHLERTYSGERMIPPPAKWSPAGDEPIKPERNRVSGQYVAVQPSLAPQFPMTVPPPYQDWSSSVAYISVKPPPMMTSYGIDVSAFPHMLSHYVPQYPCDAFSYLRSHAEYFHDQDNSQIRGHHRSCSYSQNQYNYRGGDIRATNEPSPASQFDTCWPTSNQYGYTAPYRQPFGLHPSVNHQSIWLRTC